MARSYQQNGSARPAAPADPTPVSPFVSQNPTEQMKSLGRDFRSDTVTAPTDEMFEVMKQASRGDDVYGEDAATIAFQERVAEMTGKEAGLFCVSGTMTNQLAIRSWLTQPPHSVICDSRAHIHNYEAGGIAFHSQATTLPVSPSNGHSLTLEDIEPIAVLSDDIHYAPTKLVCLENTVKGLIHPQEEIVRISDFFRARDIRMHLDGARLWEVTAKTGMSMKELCEPFDTVSLCMSKGLGAPIGSVLVGPKEVIAKARWFRKMFGGGVRQSGSLAAAASYALTHHLPLLPRTHSLATHLASSLHSLGVRILLPVQTNHVIIDTSSVGIGIWELCDRAEREFGIRMSGNRLIVHIQTCPGAVEDLVGLVAQMAREAKEQGRGNVNGDGEDGLGWREEGERHVRGEVWEGLRLGNVQIARKGIKYAGN